MGDRIDNDEEEYEEIEQNNKKAGSSNLYFFNLNKILGELLRLIIYIIILVIIFFFFMDRSKGLFLIEQITELDKQNQTLGEISVVGSEIVLEEMLVNTSDELENHFVKFKMIISYGSQETGLEINRRLNEIYDRIRKIISSKKFTDLKYIDGQEFLSLEIKTELQKITGKVDIYNIFFREFTVY